MKNSEFLRAIYGELGEGVYGWTASFRADPNGPDADWAGRVYTGTPAIASLIDSRPADNNFYCTALLAGVGEDGKPRRTKDRVHRLAVLVGDDVTPTDLIGTPSYIIQTSPGKHQAGCILDADDADAFDVPLLGAVMRAMAVRGLVPMDASGNNAVRYVRTPVGSNTKARSTGPFDVALVSCSPESTYTLDDACSVFGIDLEEVRATLISAPATLPRVTEAPGNDTASLLASLGATNPQERSYHDALLRLTGKLVASNMAPGAVVEHVRGVMLAVRPGEPHELSRWQSRFDEIPRMVSGAEKYRPTAAPSMDVVLSLPGLEPQGGLILDLKALAKSASQIRWLIKGLVPADSMGLLFGASGTYKSFVALDMALHVAHGRPWAGRKTRQGSVLYVASEGGAGIWRRVQAWHAEHGSEFTQGLHVCITPLLLSESQQLEMLTTAIAQMPVPPSLIVIDTLSQTFSGDENAASDIGDYLRSLNQELRARFSATILVIHHTGHSASERPRGSSALTANVDFMLGCFRPDAQLMACTLETHKQKDGDKAQGLTFELRRHVVGEDEDGDEVSSLVAAYNDSIDLFVAKAKTRLGRYEQVIYEHLTQPQAETELRNLVMAMCGTQEAGRKAFTRALAALRKAEMIEPSGPGLWQRKGAA